MDGLFNNREIAIGLWLMAVIVFAACFKVVRTAFAPIPKAALPILLPLLLSFIPTASVVWILAYLNLWDLSVLKETIYWVVGTGIIMFGKFNSTKDLRTLYKQTAKESLALVVVLEFFIWFYVFPLWVELLLVPFVTFIVLLATVAKYQKVDGIELTRKVLNGAQVFIGLLIILFSFIAFTKNPISLFTYQNLELFLLPIILSFTYIPSVYLIALYSKYELAFNRIEYDLSLDSKDKRRLRLAVIKRCRLSIKTTSAIIPYLALNFVDKPKKVKALKLIRTFDPNKPLYP